MDLRRYLRKSYPEMREDIQNHKKDEKLELGKN